MEADLLKRLSTRHRECLRLYHQRYRLKPMARMLGISENTVSGYLTEAVHLLNAAGRIDAAEMLAHYEATHPESRGRFSVGDNQSISAPIPEVHRGEQPISAAPGWTAFFPTRSNRGGPNDLSWRQRLTAIFSGLMLLILAIWISVALYSFSAEQMGKLIK